jgi:hypothetical protein
MAMRVLKISAISIALSAMLFANTDAQPIGQDMPQNETQGVTATDTDQTAISIPQADDNIPAQSFGEWSDEFLAKFGYNYGITKNGKTFFRASEVVTVKPTDPAFGKELQFAYEKAFLKLQADFILQTYGTIVGQTVSDYFEDDSTNAKEFEPVKVEESTKKGKLSSMLDKAIAVLDKKLDQILEEQGVEKSELNKMSVAQKKKLFKDNIANSSMKKAYQSISGLVPVKTTIVKDSNSAGSFVRVGIIAVMSDKTLQFAKDMSKKRPTHIRGKGKNLRDVMPIKDKDYLNEIGIRYLYGEDGRPMLLSYGRWSVVNKSNNPSRYAKKIETAKAKAMTIAQIAISQFQSTQITAQESAEAESISEEIAKKVTNFEGDEIMGTDESVDTINETLDKYFKKIKAKTKMKLRGTSLVRSWEAKDENGIIHVGSVVAWSYDTLESANEVARQQREQKSDKPKPKVAQPQKPKEVEVIRKESKLINSMEDF